MSESPDESLLEPDYDESVPVDDEAEPADADTDHSGPDDFGADQ